MSLFVTVPISTEVIEANPDCTFTAEHTDGVLLITVDTRCQNVHQRLSAPTPSADEAIQLQECPASVPIGPGLQLELAGGVETGY